MSTVPSPRIVELPGFQALLGGSRNNIPVLQSQSFDFFLPQNRKSTENPKMSYSQGDMNPDVLANGDNGRARGYYQENAAPLTKISVVDHHINGGGQSGSIKSDCIVVDMERISQLTEKDINANPSRITRTLSRKSSQRGGEKKTNANATGNVERDANSIAATSPRAALQGGVCTPEKPEVVTLGATKPTEHSHLISPQVHNQITIMAGNGTTTTESKMGGRRLSFRRSSAASSWTIDPRKILIFFATLSSIGTIFLIYFTLAMEKVNQDDNALS